MTARLGRNRIFCVLPDNRRLARNLILPLLSKHGKRRNRAHHAARLVRGQPAGAGEKDVSGARLRVPIALPTGPYCLEIWEPIASPPPLPVAQIVGL
jgi:hypothetical protein